MATETAQWRTRVRVNVAKTATKGYTADTTVEVEWTGEETATDERADTRLQDWLVTADGLARDEIERREAADAADAGGAP